MINNTLFKNYQMLRVKDSYNARVGYRHVVGIVLPWSEFVELEYNSIKIVPEGTDYCDYFTQSVMVIEKDLVAIRVFHNYLGDFDNYIQSPVYIGIVSREISKTFGYDTIGQDMNSIVTTMIAFAAYKEKLNTKAESAFFIVPDECTCC